MSCKERQRRSTGKEASIEDRLVILELQNRYLQVMLSSLSLCPSSTSTSESEKKKEETKPKPKIQRKKSTILISGAVEHMGKGGRYLGGGFKTSWHVVAQVVLSGTKRNGSQTKILRVSSRIYNQTDEGDDCVFTLYVLEKSTWDRNVQVRVKRSASFDGSKRKKSIEMANRATMETLRTVLLRTM